MIMTRTQVAKEVLRQVLEAYDEGLEHVTIHFDGTVDDNGLTLGEVIKEAFAPKTEMERLFRAFGGPA